MNICNFNLKLAGKCCTSIYSLSEHHITTNSLVKLHYLLPNIILLNLTFSGARVRNVGREAR